MTLSHVGTGTKVLSGATINIVPVFPTVWSPGDLFVLFLSIKPDTSNNNTSVSGWDYVGMFSGGGGTTGIDTGPTKIAVYTRVAQAGDTPQNINITSTNVSACTVSAIRSDVSGAGFLIALCGGTDSTTGTAWSVTCDANPGLEVGDFVIVGNSIPTDAANFASHGISATGVSSWSAFTEHAELETNVGNDIGLVVFSGTVQAGSATAAPVVTMTASGTTTNVRGASALLRIREDVPPPSSVTDYWGAAA